MRNGGSYDEGNEREISRRFEEDLSPHLHSQKSGAFTSFVMILLALVIIVGSFFIPMIDSLSRTILVGFGVVLLLVGGIITIVTRLYVKTAADLAYVRTGMRGKKAILNGGAIVIPVVHTVVPVSLRTHRLEVVREGGNALITGDNLRADVTAEFFIRVDAAESNIINAATTLGITSCSKDGIEKLMFPKLVSALRSVAAAKTLNDIHTKRDEFAHAVQEGLRNDLEANGLKLETVTISKLDQTPPGSMRGDDNIFDAQGLRAIAEITQAQRVERNRIERDADQEVKKKDVATSQMIFAQDVLVQRAQAEKERDIQNAQAEAKREADSFRAEQERLSGIAAVERDRAISVAQTQREQAELVAGVERDKGTELAQRDREIAIAQKETERALAEAAKAEADQERVAAQQRVTTVEVTASAERAKQKTIIEQQADSEKDLIKEQKTADAAAYTVQKKADADRLAAEARAMAITTQAEADKQAKVLEAEGQKAVLMVPVDVKAKEVAVDADRVTTVLTPELKAKADHQQVSVELEVRRLTIQADMEVGIAFAKAMGDALGTANMTIWGDPDTFQKITQAFSDGQRNGKWVEGLLDTIPDDLKTAGFGAMNGIGSIGSAILKKLTGLNIDPKEIEERLKGVK